MRTTLALAALVLAGCTAENTDDSSRIAALELVIDQLEAKVTYQGERIALLERGEPADGSDGSDAGDGQVEDVVESDPGPGPDTSEPDTAEPTGCVSDNDCKGDRVCEDGACVGPALVALGGPVTAAYLLEDPEQNDTFAGWICTGVVNGACVQAMPEGAITRRDSQGRETLSGAYDNGCKVGAWEAFRYHDTPDPETVRPCGVPESQLSRGFNAGGDATACQCDYWPSTGPWKTCGDSCPPE